MSEPVTALASPKILIVEDEQVVAMDLSRTVSNLGYVVIGSASSGADAIDLADRFRPDLVLMDIQLPGDIDGISAAAEIRSRWYIPVVFVTANANDEILNRAKETGPYGYVVKPFRPRELNATILIALHQHRLTRELFAQHTWLRTVLGSLSDGVVATDAAGRVLYINPAAEQLTGWTLAEAIGRPIEEIYRLRTIDGAAWVEKCQLRKALDAAAPVEKERFLLESRKGHTVPIEDAAAPIVEAGRVVGAATVFFDISERIRYENEEVQARQQLEEQYQATSEALGQTRAELRALSAHLMSAQEEERRRVARELHDDLGQRAAILEFHVDTLKEQLRHEPPAIQDELRAISRRVAELSEALRSVSHSLHPEMLADFGLEPALKSLVFEHCQKGREVSVSVQGLPPDVPFGVALALYRIAQEGLRNWSKHAPDAPARIRLAGNGHELQLSVEDAGPGFDVSKVRQKGGLGLLSMQERARLAGGVLTVQTRPGDGTSVHVRVPL